MSKLDKSVAETPDNKLLRAILGPEISIKEILIFAAAVIIILNALGA